MVWYLDCLHCRRCAARPPWRGGVYEQEGIQSIACIGPVHIVLWAVMAGLYWQEQARPLAPRHGSVSLH